MSTPSIKSARQIAADVLYNCGMLAADSPGLAATIEAMIVRVRVEEREACAVIADENGDRVTAATIRARGAS